MISNITENFYFCLKDRTKIMKPDENSFKLSEISYKEENMNIINITSTDTNSNKIESEGCKKDEINLLLIEENYPKESPKQEIKKYELTSNQECAAPILSEINYQINDNIESLLGKKQKPKENNIQVYITKEANKSIKYYNEDSYDSYSFHSDCLEDGECKDSDKSFKLVTGKLNSKTLEQLDHI